MKKLQQFISWVRSNGSRHAKYGGVRQIVYLNAIWLAVYLNIIIYYCIVFFWMKKFDLLFLCSVVFFNALFLAIFLLVRHSGAKLARHLFVVGSLLFIGFNDLYFGKDAFHRLYFFAFIPTFFNIFSIRKQRKQIFLYAIVPLLLLLSFEFWGYDMYQSSYSGERLIPWMRTLNIIIVYELCTLYAAYIIFNSGYKQKKLITQSLSLQTTLNNAVGAIWSIDRDYNLLAVNNAFSEFSAVVLKAPGLKDGVNIKEMTFASDLVPIQFKRYYPSVLAGKEIHENFEIGKKIYEVKAVPIVDERHHILGATFCCRDITVRAQADAMLKEAKQKAEDASQAKARFISNMSHELRTPLNGIVGVTNIMLEEDHLPTQTKNFETLQYLTEHTLQIVNNVLDVARIDAGKSQLSNTRFSLRLFINKLEAVFENTCRVKKLNFIIETIGNTDVFVKADEVRLNQVMYNLIGNAIKFTEQGFVKIVVQVHADKDEDESYHVHFRVIDSGIGIDKSHQRKIFESFTQADAHTTRQFGGSGLGITISDKILNLMQSKLRVESELGKGSCFEFEVRLRKSSVITKPLFNESFRNNYTLPGIKILLAEDNTVNQLVVKRTLQKWKVDVIEIVNNGYEAVQKVGAMNFDLILMDLDMPVMDGYEATEHIRKQHSSIPVLALTAASFDDMHSYLSRKGFDGIVQKPFRPDELFHAIVSLLQKKEYT